MLLISHLLVPLGSLQTFYTDFITQRYLLFLMHQILYQLLLLLQSLLHHQVLMSVWSTHCRHLAVLYQTQPPLLPTLSNKKLPLRLLMLLDRYILCWQIAWMAWFHLLHHVLSFQTSRTVPTLCLLYLIQFWRKYVAVSLFISINCSLITFLPKSQPHNLFPWILMTLILLHGSPFPIVCRTRKTKSFTYLPGC